MTDKLTIWIDTPLNYGRVPVRLIEKSKVRARNSTDGAPALMRLWFSCLFPVVYVLASKRQADIAYPAVREEPMVRELVVVRVARYGRLTDIGHVLPYGFDSIII